VEEPIISVSGLRGIVGRSLSSEIAIRYGCAFAEILPSGSIALGRDGRTTGPMIAAALESGLTAMGRDVVHLGVAATPTVGVMIKHLRSAGGIQISASHNPAEYNGLKLFGGDGRVVPAALGEKVIERYRAASAAGVAHDRIGRASEASDTVRPHLDLVLGVVDVERIRRRRFKVLLDASHGAGAILGRPLLEALGCELRLVGATADGLFEHPPEPTAENLASVRSQVTEAGADIGFCQDPDADRLAVIDERGQYLGEEYTLAMAVDHVLRARRGPVVTNCSTSRMTEDLAKKYGVPFFRSAVGEANVVDAMRRHKAVIGGEGNGGVIDPRVVEVRDSFTGMAIILDAMAQREQKVSQLAAELPRYEIVKAKIPLAGRDLAAATKSLKRHFADATADTLDGLRLDWPDKWLLIRASNTEPIARAVAEAPTAAEAQRLCDEALRVMSQG